MKDLHLNPKALIIFLFFILLTSCNNEEIFLAEESAEVIEEVEEELPDNEDEAAAIQTLDDVVNTVENLAVDTKLYLNDLNLPTIITFSNTNPSNGVLEVNDNETPNNLLDDFIIYRPNAGFFGIDTFEYTICDASNEENCDTASVTINIEPRENDFATELKAFPSAIGAGANATGGRGGVVLHVTNLNDSGAGSFREALLDSRPRTIVFDVSGIINMSNIGVRNGNLTIAGQTAPEGGITVICPGFSFQNADNTIVRYIRFRAPSGTGSDALSGYYLNNFILDHCSISFGQDETVSFISDIPTETTGNVTISSCLMAEGKNGSLLGSQEYPEVVGDFSIVNNLWYNLTHRLFNAYGNGRFDDVNNLKWGFRYRITLGLYSPQINNINNWHYFSADNTFYGLNGATAITKENGTEDGNSWSSQGNKLQFHGKIEDLDVIPQIHTSGNTYHGFNSATYTDANGGIYTDVNGDNFKDTWGVYYSDYDENSYAAAGISTADFNANYQRGVALQDNWERETQFPLNGVAFPILTAAETYTKVSNDVGANKRLNADGSIVTEIDMLDTEYINAVKTKNFISRRNSDTDYITPDVFSQLRNELYDTDKDGMPDVWEIRTFGDLTKDGSSDTDGDGYTDLEEFLNLIDL